MSEQKQQPIISIDHVSMRFNLAKEKHESLKEYFVALLHGGVRFDEFFALSDVSFDIMPGDFYGLIGLNGSGKSTLLKVISGVYKPSAGKVTVNGTIAPLIELGAGFDMDLTARENIYLNGTVLGYTPKYIDSKFDDIVEFSELQEFLDVPLKNYSSGMVARLAFAVATMTKPDILIADEILSVGDFLFQEKCEKRMAELLSGGTTVILVSHSIEQIERMCNKVAWLDQPDLLTCVDHADAVFLYELSVRERTDLVEYCYQTRKDLYYSLEMSDVVAMAGERVMFDDKTMMYCPVRELRFEERIVKRLGDILVSVVGLVLTSPILLATALAIRLEDGGPVFYRQKRATYGGRVFEVYKFRSMRAQDGSIHVSAKKDDDRITKVGRIIRKFRIDELPQLINVLKSDMSIVGPRPEMLENVEKYTDDLPEFRYRLRAKAGLTGLAQIYGKYNTSPRDKLIMDLAYIQQYSVWLDLKLILRTALVLLTPEESTEAFEDKKTEEKP